jgi:hypothetical protein
VNEVVDEVKYLTVNVPLTVSQLIEGLKQRCCLVVIETSVCEDHGSA